MENLISHILNFFTDKTRSIGSKSLFFIAVIFCFFAFDYFTGLTFYISTNSKLNQIETIERIKRDNPNDSKLSEELNKIELEILNRKSIRDYFSFFDFSNLNFIKSDSPESLDSLKRLRALPDTSNAIEQKSKIKEVSSEQVSGRRSNFVHILTSSYSFVILLVMIPFAFFAEKTRNRNYIVGVLFATMFILVLIWFFSYLFSLIPLLKYPWVNYLVNFALHSLFLLFIFAIGKNKKSA